MELEVDEPSGYTTGGDWLELAELDVLDGGLLPEDTIEMIAGGRVPVEELDPDVDDEVGGV